jgi:hypothetical protein
MRIKKKRGMVAFSLGAEMGRSMLRPQKMRKRALVGKYDTTLQTPGKMPPTGLWWAGARDTSCSNGLEKRAKLGETRRKSGVRVVLVLLKFFPFAKNILDS